MNVQTVVQLSGQIASLQQRVTVLQNQIMAVNTNSKVHEVIARQIAKLEQDLKATTAVVMMLRLKIKKYKPGSTIDINIEELKKLIQIIKEMIGNPNNSIFMTSQPIISKPEQDPPYIINENAKMNWNLTNPNEPVLTIKDKTSTPTIKVDPNNKVITVGDGEQKITLDGENGKITLDESVSINSDGVIKVLLTDPTEPNNKELIALSNPTNVWPEDNFDKTTDSLYDYLKNKHGNGFEKIDPEPKQGTTAGTISWGDIDENTRGIIATAPIKAVQINLGNEKIDADDVVSFKDKLDAYSSAGKHNPSLQWTLHQDKPQITFIDDVTISGQTVNGSLPILRKGDIETLADMSDILDIKPTGDSISPTTLNYFS